MNQCWPSEVNQAHVALLRYIWLEMLPAAFSWFSVDDAWETWTRFRNNPSDPRLKNIKLAVRELWDLHVTTN